LLLRGYSRRPEATRDRSAANDVIFADVIALSAAAVGAASSRARAINQRVLAGGGGEMPPR